MSYLEELIISINRTHKGLGELVAMMQVVVKARKMMLVVSPSGCGKSRAMEFIRRNTPDAFMPDRLSIRGLAGMEDILTSFRSVIIVDDIANSQNDYVRKTTITTLSSLVYTHRIQSQMMQSVDIEDYYGSAILGIQPILLRDVMLTPEWDASIQDKVLRYYHVQRPIEPNLGFPDVKMSYGIDFDKAIEYKPDTKLIEWKQLVALGDTQWSRARTREHMLGYKR